MLEHMTDNIFPFGDPGPSLVPYGEDARIAPDFVSQSAKQWL